MDNTPEVLFDAKRVKEAIDAARAFAESKGVPMTVERLAVCLGVSSRQLIKFVLEEDEPEEGLRESHSQLRLAFDEIAACHIEHGMTKGNNPSMDIFMLKSNLNYREKGEPPVQNTAVVFFGEDALKD
ncbi:MAG TPA: hypothetical protein GXX54_08690 [Clostridiales bacterium]|nr:hypothetical protein [Clostridiales bacterium]